ncbi:uncharacterized protein LOC143288780 [Babylonia areolata]|uniref:uncharacterized protein LOC143288780 n=1 Tax=Babylonia areolata TaxID=304850 RepID=UPI003FD4CEDD
MTTTTTTTSSSSSSNVTASSQNNGSGADGHPPASSNDVVPTSESGSSVGIGNVSSLLINATVTAQPSTGGDDGPGVPGGVIALVLCLLLIGVAVLGIIFYLKRTGRLYKMIPFKPLTSSARGSSLTNSHRALHEEYGDGDDPAEDFPQDHRMDDLETPANNNNPPSSSARGLRHSKGRGRERDAAAGMFTIEDHDMDSVDIDIGGTRGGNDEYFYDEVFGKSVFEDEATNASMRQLYLASDQDQGEEEEDVLDVDALVDSITGKSSDKAAKT